METITNKYTTTGQQIEAKLAELAEEKTVQEKNAALLKSFADSSAAYQQWVQEQTAELSKEAEGSLEEQLDSKKQKGQQAITSSADQLKQLQSAYEQLEAADIAELSNVTYQELQVLDAQIQKTVSQVVQTIEQQILAQKLSNVTEQQLKDFRETFNHFDAQKTGFLTKLQFRSAVSAVGEEIADDKLEAAFKEYDKDGDNKVCICVCVIIFVTRLPLMNLLCSCPIKSRKVLASKMCWMPLKKFLVAKTPLPKPK